jgi:membrane-associated HD superfamily phosphohydrolase
MAKDTGKAGRTAASRVKFTTQGLRWRDRLASLADHEALGWGLLACVLFVLVVGSVSVWTLEQPRVAVGQIMRETRLARVEFNTEDTHQTDMRREAARQNTPRIYSADLPVLEELRASIANLPRTLAGVDSLDRVDQDIRVKFGLSPDLLAAVRDLAQDEDRLASWAVRTARLDEILRRRPILSGQSWQRVTQEGLSPQIELRVGPAEEGGTREFVSRDDAINIENAEMLRREVERIVRIAGFEAPLDQVVRNRLDNSQRPSLQRPTFSFNASATSEAQALAAERVPTVRRNIAVGQKIYGRGEVLDADQLNLFLREREQFRAQGGCRRSWPVARACSG